MFYIDLPLPDKLTLRHVESLVGLEYIAGRFDCMHLAVLAQRVLFGRQVQWLEQQHPRGVRHQEVWILRHHADLARELGPHEAPESGDAVLWRRVEDAGYHIGTLFIEGGQQWVLHTSEAMGSSVLQRMADCTAQGLRLCGFYRWRA